MVFFIIRSLIRNKKPRNDKRRKNMIAVCKSLQRLCWVVRKSCFQTRHTQETTHSASAFKRNYGRKKISPPL